MEYAAYSTITEWRMDTEPVTVAVTLARASTRHRYSDTSDTAELAAQDTKVHARKGRVALLEASSKR